MTAPRCRSPGRTDLASFFSPLSSHFLSFSFFLSSSLFLSLPFKLYFLLPIFLSFPHPHLSIAFHFPRHHHYCCNNPAQKRTAAITTFRAATTISTTVPSADLSWR